MHYVAKLDNSSFDSDALLPLLHIVNRHIAEQRQAGNPVTRGTIHRDGKLMYVLKNEHMVKP